MAQTIDVLKTNNHTISVQLKTAKTESDGWYEEAKTLKFYNVILKNTINQLKSPQLIDKYQERGRQIAEKEFKRLLINRPSQAASRSNTAKTRTKNYLITSGEGQIKES